MKNSRNNNKSNSSENKELIDLKSQINTYNINIQNLKNSLKEKDSIISKLKNELENMNKNIIKKKEFVKRDDIVVVNFSSMDQKINFAIPSIGTDIFAEIEEKLYQEFPEYRESNNYFLLNGKEILRFKTINENKIKSGRPIILVKPS